MAVNYTSLLGLVQPVDGTEAGTWGDDVNNGISSILDVAVAGTQNITTDGNVTLTITQATSSGTNLTSTSAQYAVLLLSGSRTANRSVTLPASSKIYTVLNSTTGGYAQTVGGLSIANGEYCQIIYNTSTASWVKAGTNTVTATTATNISGGAANQIVFQAGSGSTSFITAPTGGSTLYLTWNGSTFAWASTIASGVSSITAGTGLSASSSTGNITLTNTGVTSLSAGTGISLSANTGAITISASGSGGGVTSISASSPLSASSSTGAVSLSISNVALLSATNYYSGYNNFGYGSTGFAPPGSPYIGTIYSNATGTSGVAIVTAAYNGTESNWDAIVGSTSQGIAYFNQGTSGGALTGIGSITYNGTGTSYNTSSDRRLKDNIAALPAGTGLAKIAALQPRAFTWKQTGTADMGFIADELQAVVPNAVSGQPDDVREDGSIKPQGIDTSFLVVYLVQAIQEMTAEIVTLKAKVGV